MARRFRHLLGGAAAIALATTAAPVVAHATPYAYASNQITGLLITFSDGTRIPVNTTSDRETIAANAQFSGSTPAANQGSGSIDAAVGPVSAYAGPDASPPAASFGAVGPGNFTGARSVSSIGAADATTGEATVSNAAEAYGNQLGNSTANNNATIVYTVTGTGVGIKLVGLDAFSLTSSTSSLFPGETATATIANTLSITNKTTGTPLTPNDAPGPINVQVTSSTGVPPINTSSNSSFDLTYLSPVLVAGDVYNISLLSSATVSILPGTPVPEPGSLLLLGTGVLGIGMLGLRRRRL